MPTRSSPAGQGFDAHRRLFQQQLGVGLIKPGEGRWERGSRMIAEKTAPCTIIARACVGRYEVRSRGRHGVAMAGDLFLAAKGDPLWIAHHLDPDAGFMHARWLHAHYTLFGVIDAVGLLDLPLIVRGEPAQELGAIIDELLLTRTQPELGLVGAARRHELVFAALRVLCGLAPLRPEAVGGIDSLQRLAVVFDYVDQHLAEDLSVADLARLVHLSTPRFFAVFKAHAGVSPKAFVSQARLTRASHMLIATDLPVADIGRRVGLSDPFHFSRAFRSRFGQPPLAYRATHRAGGV